MFAHKHQSQPKLSFNIIKRTSESSLNHSRFWRFGNPLLKPCELNIFHSLINLHLICVRKRENINLCPACFFSPEPTAKRHWDQRKWLLSTNPKQFPLDREVIIPFYKLESWNAVIRHLLTQKSINHMYCKQSKLHRYCLRVWTGQFINVMIQKPPEDSDRW